MSNFTPTIAECVFLTWVDTATKRKVEFICHRNYVYCMIQPGQQKQLLPLAKEVTDFTTDVRLDSQWYKCIPEITNEINQRLINWLKDHKAYNRVVITREQQRETVAKDLYQSLFKYTQDLEKQKREAEKLRDEFEEAARVLAEKYDASQANIKAADDRLHEYETIVAQLTSTLTQEVDIPCGACCRAPEAFGLLDQERDRSIQEGPTLHLLLTKIVQEEYVTCLKAIITTAFRRQISLDQAISLSKLLLKIQSQILLLKDYPSSSKIFNKILNFILDGVIILTCTKTTSLSHEDLQCLNNLRLIREQAEAIYSGPDQKIDVWPPPQQEHWVKWVVPQFQECSDSLDSLPLPQPLPTDSEISLLGRLKRTLASDSSLESSPDLSESGWAHKQ